MKYAKNFDCPQRLSHLPEPVYEPDPDFITLYRVAWESAARHVKHISGMPQTPYMDEAFCHTKIWIWDTCFMSLFCKYAADVFPGVESLHNFYDVFYGGKSYPLVTCPEGEPEWTKHKAGERVPLKVNIADNPPLFAWVEYENALFSGDLEHVRNLLLKDRFLQRHYDWLENLTEPCRQDWYDAWTCWQAHPQGYAWEGGRSGMDNSPRGRQSVPSLKERPGTPDTLWVDALSQQALAARCIGRLFRLIGEDGEAARWQRAYEHKADLLRTLYWCEEDQIFYDISVTDGSFCKVPTIASFWPLTVGAATQEQADAMAEKLEDPRYFGGDRPFLSLARKDPDFVPDGGAYWRGGIWLPTAYATVRGLMNYGKFDCARRNSRKLLRQMWATYSQFEPHSIWESYSPSGDEPGQITTSQGLVRKDFCGWSALGPVSLLLESVIGIHKADAFKRELYWESDPQVQGKTGVKNLTFGEITTSLVLEGNTLTVTSDAPYTLLLNGAAYGVTAGERTLRL